MMRKIDCHVHLVGDGSSDSGCWFRLDTLYHRLQARFMLKGLGIDPKHLRGELDDAYVEALASHVRSSTLDAVVLLAQDIPYDDAGNPVPEKGGFYVPNEYLFQIIEKYPDLFIPAVSIHPGRRDAMEELERCIDRGARVLKLLPNCLNIDCASERFRPFWGADGFRQDDSASTHGWREDASSLSPRIRGSRAFTFASGLRRDRHRRPFRRKIRTLRSRLHAKACSSFPRIPEPLWR